VYTAFALSTLGFVAFAMTQRVDLVREDYYQESLRTTDAKLERQRAKDAGAAINIDGRMLRVVVDDPQARPTTATLHLYRPDNPSQDMHETIVAREDNALGYSLADVAPGHWRAIVRWRARGEIYEVEQTLMLR
jgi:hypothetical protein